jgi:hypothetical protein
VILAELTGDDSIVDTGPPKREVAKPPTKDHVEWRASALERRKVNYFEVSFVRLFLCG